MRSWILSLIPVVISALVGCGSSELHTLQGSVALQDSSEFKFAGDVLELQLEGNPLQRAFGEIEAGGSFHIETLDKGKIASGIRPGVYQARIVLCDDDPQHVKLASRAIDRKFTRFESSGLKVRVPSRDVILQVSAKVLR